MDQHERLAAIWDACVEKLQEVVREYRITQDELHIAGDYFDRLGKAGFSRSLIDVGLAMTSVDIFDGARGGTRPNLEGPYHGKHPSRPNGRFLDRDIGSDENKLIVKGTVRDAESGEALSGVMLDFWQADGNGIYDLEGPNLRGIVRSGEDGSYAIETVLPKDYSQHDFDPIGELFRAMKRPNSRAAHIHLKASRDGREVLTTQIFMPTSKLLKDDYVKGAVSDDLVVELEEGECDERGRVVYYTKFDIELPRAE